MLAAGESVLCSAAQGDFRPTHLTDIASRAVARTTDVNLEPNDSRRLAALCGPFDQNLKQLERRLGIRIRNRGNAFRLSGPEERVAAGRVLLAQLYGETSERDTLEGDTVHLFLQEAGMEEVLANGNG